MQLFTLLLTPGVDDVSHQGHPHALYLLATLLPQPVQLQHHTFTYNAQDPCELEKRRICGLILLPYQQKLQLPRARYQLGCHSEFEQNRQHQQQQQTPPHLLPRPLAAGQSAEKYDERDRQSQQSQIGQVHPHQQTVDYVLPVGVYRFGHQQGQKRQFLPFPAHLPSQILLALPGIQRQRLLQKRYPRAVPYFLLGLLPLGMGLLARWLWFFVSQNNHILLQLPLDLQKQTLLVQIPKLIQIAVVDFI